MNKDIYGIWRTWVNGRTMTIELTERNITCNGSYYISLYGRLCKASFHDGGLFLNDMVFYKDCVANAEKLPQLAILAIR